MSVKAKNIQTWVNIPKGYSLEERKAIALEILNFIRKRSEDGIAVNGSAFPEYSKEYIKSLDFKNAGKSSGKRNLTLSGDMLAAIKLLDNQRGKIKIGYDTGDSEAGRAEGNQIGSYGMSSGNRSKARPFIGIKRKDLEEILSMFPIDDDEARDKQVANTLDGDLISDDIVDSLYGGEDD